MDPSDLSTLSKSAGIDLVALKAKYQRVAQENAASAALNPSAASQQALEDTKRQKADMKADTERLNNYKVCPNCQGSGIVKSIYNHMVMERDCEVCDGECVMMTATALAAAKKAAEEIGGDVEDAITESKPTAI